MTHLPETKQPHKYTTESLLWYQGHQVKIKRLLWNLRGLPVYELFGLKNPVKETELKLLS